MEGKSLEAKSSLWYTSLLSRANIHFFLLPEFPQGTLLYRSWCNSWWLNGRQRSLSRPYLISFRVFFNCLLFVGMLLFFFFSCTILLYSLENVSFMRTQVACHIVYCGSLGWYGEEGGDANDRMNLSSLTGRSRWCVVQCGGVGFSGVSVKSLPYSAITDKDQNFH